MAAFGAKKLRPAREGRKLGRSLEDWRENNKIITAAKRGDIDTLVSMSQSGIDVSSARDGWGSTPLHYAALNGHSETIDSLIRAGATVDIMNKFGNTPLADAVDGGHGDIVKTLIQQHNADPAKVHQRLQQKMKQLLREEEEKARASAYQERQERKAFQLAMRDGVANSLSFRLCMFGPENSGKTCLVDTLFDDIFQQQEATQGADVHICTIYASNWQKCTSEQMADNIQTQFFHGLNISAIEQVESPSFRATAASGKPGLLTKFKAVLFQSNPRSSSELHKAPEVKLEDIKQAKAIKIVSEKEFTAIVWDFAGQIEYLSTHTVFIRRDNIVFIVFKASCHLTGLIKARPGDEDSASSSKPTTHFHVIHYWLQAVTSVCHDTGGSDHMSEFLPTAVLIATHIDEIMGDLEQAKEAIIAQLAKELEGKPYAKHLAGNLPGVGLLNALRKFCIFLSNKVRDENIITQLKEIVLQISAPSMKEKHPLIYLKIEKELLLLRKEVITTTEFHKIAVENGFMAKENSIEMKGALDHFHQKGMILHFPSINSLNQLVFLSPQWLEKLIAFLVIAHHYKPMGDKDDHSYRRLKHEGVLVGSFLNHSLQMFNKLNGVIGCEISFVQAVAFLANFGFIAEISITTEFLEESHPWSEGETRIFIVPSRLPEGKEERKRLFVKGKHVWPVYFTFIDGFIPLTIFHQMIAACINWNECRKQNIVWLQKYDLMMVLNHGQYYSVSLCEAKSSIQVDIILGKSMKESAENRKQLIDFFQTTLEEICDDLIPASSKPIPYIQCPHCDKVHLKLRNVVERRALLCSTIPVPQDYYQDLFSEFQVSTKSKQLNEDIQPVTRTALSKNTAAAPSTVNNPQQAACSDHGPEAMTQHTPLATSTATTTTSRRGIDSSDHQTLDQDVSVNFKAALDYLRNHYTKEEQVPTMKQLMDKVIPRVAADWKQLAFMLEFDIPRVNIVKQKGRDDPESCCYELLCEWLSTDHGMKPKNWTTLLTALKQIKKLTSVTDEIEKDLEMQLTMSQCGYDVTTPVTHSNVLSQVPTMHHVIRVVVPKIAGHWKTIAFNLHYDVTRVRIIQEQCRDDPEQCSCELFMYWLQSSEGLGPRSWQTLLSVLKDTPKLTAVSESIEKELIELLMSND